MPPVIERTSLKMRAPSCSTTIIRTEQQCGHDGDQWVQPLWETSVIPGASSIYGGMYPWFSTAQHGPTNPFYGIEASQICAKCRQARISTHSRSAVRSGGSGPAMSVRRSTKSFRQFLITLPFTTLIMSLAVDSGLTLSSGASIPQFGFGSTPETYASVTKALELGIRHCRYSCTSSRA